MAYSEDLRRKVIAYLEDGNTLESASKVFKIGLTTIKEWKNSIRKQEVWCKSGGKILAPLQYGGMTDSVLFEYWFEHLLLPVVPKNSIIVMDNAAFHRKKVLRELIAKTDCTLLFLPPYSSDLNPIENFWAWLKHKLQSVLSFSIDFDSALSACFHLC